MTESREEKAETARIRRRWVTLGEVLAVVAVAISGMTLWNSWAERTDQRIEKAGEAAKASNANRTLLLKGTADRSAQRIDMVPLRAEQGIQGQTITFPPRLAWRRSTPRAMRGSRRAGWTMRW